VRALLAQQLQRQYGWSVVPYFFVLALRYWHVLDSEVLRCQGLILLHS
jgi:hypothetical protein